MILLWNTRSKHLPVLKTSLSVAGHTYPVYAMQMLGIQNAHNLNMLSHRCVHLFTFTARMMLTQRRKLPRSGVGTKEGKIYQAKRHDSAGAIASLDQ
jgi:dynein intermediate chain, cytosolic